MAAPPTRPGARLRRARVAVSVVFALNAVLYANLVPRLPEVKDGLALTNTALGSAIAAMPVGALLAGLLAPLLIGWIGSARLASLGIVALAVTVAGVPFVASWAGFAALLLLVGALDAVVDVAQNAHGFRVQRGYGRSIVHAFHGMWSVGAVLGGVLGSLAAGLGAALGTHLVISGVVFSLIAVVAAGFLLDGPEDAERPVPEHTGAAAVPRPALAGLAGRTVGLLAVLGALAAAGAVVEDAGSSWGALYLRTEVGAAAAAWGLAFVSLQVAMTVGRLTGDRVVERFGQRRVTRVGGAGVALGIGLALVVPSVATTVVGFALAGLGVATLVPAVMHAADELPGLAPGVGLTVVSWLLRVGFLVSPAVIGVVADAAGLRLALLQVVGAGVVIVVLGRVLQPGTGRGAAVGPGGGPGAPAA